MMKLRKVVGVIVVALFALNFIIPPGVFAQPQQNAEMEKKCAATKAGTETDEAVRQSCATYFEQTEAAAAAGASGGEAATAGVSKGTVALTIIGIALLGGAAAAAGGGGGGGGGGGAVPKHKK
ncbi:MAG TPA: hypothetical protein PK125_13090 [Syntrophorhabdus sp.]|jgi:uncharacterized ion transporter superfamily protein YfcC|nr:hypothetical protein [Pseudomonadota bacterium]NMC93508.1 hypothetical protein [Syntrophorhabdus sp.]OQB74553.1 MAG: hypothetical protein BWX92_02979 [Deltaproteobacteria bacterium ADurb.Bin135]HNQ46949.1 hypothetical protein [Syntrophorhabdus sp.]HNY71365.1 hypothetical protein [Syntrophorhabdus sp.]